MTVLLLIGLGLACFAAGVVCGAFYVALRK